MLIHPRFTHCLDGSQCVLIHSGLAVLPMLCTGPLDTEEPTEIPRVIDGSENRMSSSIGLSKVCSLWYVVVPRKKN